MQTPPHGAGYGRVASTMPYGRRDRRRLRHIVGRLNTLQEDVSQTMLVHASAKHSESQSSPYAAVVHLGVGARTDGQ
jgi:hypothetical protein